MVRVLLFTLLSAILLFMVIGRSTIYVVKVNGSSMKPTLFDGDRLIVMRRLVPSLLQHGQIVICDFRNTVEAEKESQNYVVKRLTGLPGQRLYFKDSEISTNWGIYKYLKRASDKWYFDIPLGYCYLTADGQGGDSRIWGPVSVESLKGIVLFKLPK
jgi:signal peptidase I